MLYPARIVAGLLAIALVGCASAPPRGSAPPPDWSSKGSAPKSGLAGQATSVNRLESPAPIARVAAESRSRAAAAPGHLDKTWVPLDLWCRANGIGSLREVKFRQATAFVLATATGMLLLRPGSDSAEWHGVELRLGFAPRMVHGQPFVHALDLEKTIEPLLSRPRERRRGAQRVIVIDPGHGGEDAGAPSVLGGHYEKEYTLDWARRLGRLLAADGWRVFLTRRLDLDVPIAKRIAFADAHKADLFVSLHFNSAGRDRTQEGLETYCLTPEGLPSSITRGYGDDPTLIFPNNAFDRSNFRLACRIQRALLRVNGDRDRGVRRARFLGVLRGQHRPAVLIEGGYLSSPREARLIAEPAYREKLAQAVARALEE
jgi:N-acetylmuramoyl-L-alanine amidase